MEIGDRIIYRTTDAERAVGWADAMPGVCLAAVLPDVKVVVWNPNEDRAMYFWSTVGAAQGQCEVIP